MSQLQENSGVTALLAEWRSGNPQALEQLTPLVYGELKRLAERMFHRESPGHTLQPTALVNEAFEALVRMDVSFQDRTHFFALSARLMRRILVNHARDRMRQKRGGDRERVSLSLAADAFPRPEVDILALHDALDRLTTLDARKGRIVELKFFGGLTTTEIGEVLNVSPATVERDWNFSRAWLCDALTDEPV